MLISRRGIRSLWRRFGGITKSVYSFLPLPSSLANAQPKTILRDEGNWLMRGNEKQVHTSPTLKKQAEEFGIPVLEADGIAEVWVDSLEDWKCIVNDPEFITAIVR